jgi:uncharacterized protein (DUF885 family)
MRAMAGYQVHSISQWKGPYRDLQDNGYGLLPANAIQEKVAKISKSETSLRDWGEVMSYLRGLGRYLEQHENNLREGLSMGFLPDRRIATHEVDDSRSSAEFFGAQLVAAAKDSLTRAEFAKVRAELDREASQARQAYLKYAVFLEQNLLPVAGDHYAIGRDEYAYRLRAMGISDSPEQIYEQGLASARQIRARMEAVAKRLAPDKTLSDVIAEMQAAHPKDDREMLERYTQAVAQAREFVTENRLFDIPKDFVLPIVPTPASMQSTNPEAAYLPAPPLDPSIHGVFLVTPSKADPQVLADQNYSAILNTAVHEAIPGHGLEYYYFQRRPAGASVLPSYNDSGNGLGGFYASSLHVEGWAFHIENLMIERGYYKNPKDELSALQALLLRAYRLVLDTGLHTGALSFDDAVQTMKEQVFSPPPVAREEIFRYSSIPTQAVTYMLGHLQIEKLKEDYRAVMGPDYSEAGFYRAFAQFGPAPPSVIAPILLEEARKELRAGVK